MSLIYSVIICLFLKADSCRCHCVEEMMNLDDKEFSINMTEHIRVQSGECIAIPYEFSFPTNKVTVPYEKIWFNGNSQTSIESIEVVHNMDSDETDVFWTDGLPHGEYTFGFKLEWGCNQTYIFPKRVQISVSELKEKPHILVPFMKEGSVAILQCYPPSLCSGQANVYWKQTKADEETIMFHDDVDFYWMLMSETLPFTPTADDHNTNITCVAEYDYNVIEETVTLNVNFPPKIQHGSHCMVEGALLVCVCISWGNPLAPITWPLASLTDYSVSSSSNMLTVNSTITMHAADYHNTTVKCISSNEWGQAEIEMPLQNYTERQSYGLDWKQKCGAVYPWITAVSVSVNLMLLASLIICTYKWRRRVQKDVCEELNTYASLSKAHVEEEYSVISPQPK